VSLSKTLNP